MEAKQGGIVRRNPRALSEDQERVLATREVSCSRRLLRSEQGIQDIVMENTRYAERILLDNLLTDFVCRFLSFLHPFFAVRELDQAGLYRLVFVHLELPCT